MKTLKINPKQKGLTQHRDGHIVVTTEPASYEEADAAILLQSERKGLPLVVEVQEEDAPFFGTITETSDDEVADYEELETEDND